MMIGVLGSTVRYSKSTQIALSESPAKDEFSVFGNADGSKSIEELIVPDGQSINIVAFRL